MTPRQILRPDRTLLAVGALLAIAGSLAAAPIALSPSQLAISDALATRVSLAFADTPVADVAGYLRQELSVNIVLDPRAVADNERLVTLSLKDVRAKDALELITKFTGLAYAVQHGAIVISTPDLIRRGVEVDMRIYDVRDFVTMDVGSRSSSGASDDDDFGDDDDDDDDDDTGMSRGRAYRALIRLIVEMTGPENWRRVGVLGATSDDDEERGSLGDDF